MLFAIECEMHDGLHVQPEFGVMEIVGDDGEALPEGRFGRIIATGLQNYGIPLVRCEVGEVSARIGGSCGCGRTLPRLAAVTAKAEDPVVTPEGRFVLSPAITYPLDPMTRIEKG